MSSMHGHPELGVAPLTSEQRLAFQAYVPEFESPDSELPDDFWREVAVKERILRKHYPFRGGNGNDRFHIVAEHSWAAASNNPYDDFDTTAFSAHRDAAAIPLAGIRKCMLTRFNGHDLNSGRFAPATVYELNMIRGNKKLRVFPMRAVLTQHSVSISDRSRIGIARSIARDVGASLRPIEADAELVLEQLALGVYSIPPGHARQ